MINVADRDLCEKLKKLSNWSDTMLCWNGQLIPSWWPIEMRAHDVGSAPAYDLGFLIRKLPLDTKLQVVGYRDEADRKGKPAPMYIFTSSGCGGRSDSAEDAAVLLAIELFKNKVLKRERSK